MRDRSASSLKANAKKSLFYSLYASLSVFLAGCQLTGPYRSPLTPVPTDWKHDAFLPSLAEESEETYCLDNWWEVFEDSVLTQIEEQAVANSPNLQAAFQRILQAKAQTNANRSSLLPQLNFAPAFSRSGLLVQNPFPGAGGSSTLSVNGVNVPLNGTTPTGSDLTKAIFRFVQSQYILPFNLSYEIDLWGRLQNIYESSLLRTQAAANDYLSILLTMTGDVAAHYFQMRSLDSQLFFLSKIEENLQKELLLIQQRFSSGLVTYLNVAEADASLANLQANRKEIERQRLLEEDILATLSGTPASLFHLEASPLVEDPPLIPVGLPSSLLLRRPDIRTAERTLAANYKEIGAAYANFFPSLSLNGGLGWESPLAVGLISWNSRFWQIGANVLQSIFDGGYNQAQLDLSKAKFQEALANYQQQVLTSFQEVEDALGSLEKIQSQESAFKRAEESAKTAFFISSNRYRRGFANYLEVSGAERTLLQNQQNATIATGQRYLYTIHLIKSLGGGWGKLDTSLDLCYSSAQF